MLGKIKQLLGNENEPLLAHVCKCVSKEQLHLPGSDYVERIFAPSDRPIPVLRSLQNLFSHGRLGGTGYLSILPCGPGIEHSAGASFAPNPIYFDPENIVKLAIEGGCNAVASTLGVLGAVARKYAYRIPFIVKLNHNELLTYPNTYDQILFGVSIRLTIWERLALAPPFTLARTILRARSRKLPKFLNMPHQRGMFTVLWCTCAIRLSRKIKDYHLSR